MPEPRDRMIAIEAARRAVTEALREVARMRERHARAKEALRELRRRIAPRTAAPRLARQEQELLDASEALAGASDTLEAKRRALAALESAAADDVATVEAIEQAMQKWSTDVPVLLFPVRVETRFRATETADGVVHELLVRVYPDAAMIDSFEETLTTSEVRNARRYWMERWRTGGTDAGERGAWRLLVDSHGSGRAGWIVDHYGPVNPGDVPVSVQTTDVNLIIAADASLTAAERVALSTYWTRVWRAPADAVARGQATAGLNAAVGEARAGVLAERYAPFNLDDAPTAGTTRASVTVRVAYIEFPAEVETQRLPWSRAPHVAALPDRFVVIATSGSDKPIEAVGRRIPSTLAAGLDPSADPADRLHAGPNGLVYPADIAWMVDFDRAVNVGMGLRVLLTVDQAARGIDRLIVLGVRLAADAGEGGRLLTTLLEHHRDSPRGLGIVPQGTPTNNTESTPSGYTRRGDADASLRARKAPMPIVDPSDALAKRDGQWLAELLGVDPAIFSRVEHAAGTDQQDARAMQRALWPATGGYFLDTMLNPIVSDADVEHTSWFFTRYVSGRGAIPAIRVGAQPYGILPTTAFSRVIWPEDPDAKPGTRGHFLMRLWDILRRLEATWAAMARRVAHVGKAGDPHEILLDVLGLHPTSEEFAYRYAQSGIL